MLEMSAAQQLWDSVHVAWVIDEWGTISILRYPSLAFVVLAHSWENKNWIFFPVQSPNLYTFMSKRDILCPPNSTYHVHWSYTNTFAGCQETLTKAVKCCTVASGWLLLTLHTSKFILFSKL